MCIWCVHACVCERFFGWLGFPAYVCVWAGGPPIDWRFCWHMYGCVRTSVLVFILHANTNTRETCSHLDLHTPIHSQRSRLPLDVRLCLCVSVRVCASPVNNTKEKQHTESRKKDEQNERTKKEERKTNWQPDFEESDESIRFSTREFLD